MCELFSLFVAVSIVSLYVGSLYFWGGPNKCSDTYYVKSRLLSVVLTALISTLIVYLISEEKLWSLTSFHVTATNLLQKVCAPFGLTSLLFLCPVALELRKFMSTIKTNELYSRFDNFSPVIFGRNYVICPTTEEYVFRGILFAVLHPCFSKITYVLLSSFFFSVSHSHRYVFEAIFGEPEILLLPTLVQMSFTFVFGLYSCAVYLKTGFPDFEELFSSKVFRVLTIWGALCWAILFVVYVYS